MRKSLAFALAALLACPLLAQRVEAGLYRPWKPELAMTYAPAQVDSREPLTPLLYLYGTGFANGAGTLTWTLRGAGKTLGEGTQSLPLAGGFFEKAIALDQGYPGAECVAWRLQQGERTLEGEAPLAWSRFTGQLAYEDGRWRPTYIRLSPCTFNEPVTFVIPVPEDGHFDVQVPARVYGVVNVNGAGYSVDAMERWGWSYDLRHDRRDTFRIGRTELYSMHAFTLRGGPTTVFVAFRPTCLTKVLRHTNPPGSGPKSMGTMRLIAEALRDDPMAIAPDLKKEQVKVWLDGVSHPVTDLSRITETNAMGIFQVQYILQFAPPERPARGRWHEVKVEVASQDVLDGRRIQDFGQGSAGFYLD